MLKSLALIIFLLFVALATKTYGHVISAYSAYHGNKRIWIKVDGGLITKVSTRKIAAPASELIYSSDYVFPGLIDLHNHLQYNVLPLWNKAQGQYSNRFEWRKDSKYKSYVSQAMRVFQKNGRNDLKNNILWAELKALAGGTTALLGAGGNAYLGQEFGAINLELIQSYLTTEKSVDLSTDIISDKTYEEIYLPYMESALRNGLTWDEAYGKYLEGAGIASWYNEFMNADGSLNSYLNLLFAGVTPEKLENVTITEENIDILLDELLDQRLAIKVWDKDRTKSDIKDFLFGSRRNESVLEVAKTIEMAKKFFALDGNFMYHYSIRDFAFEFSQKREAFLESASHKNHDHSLVVHLSEGKKEDSFTSKEFNIAKQMGFARRGLVIIHGMGMSEEELKFAAKQKVSLVWSPYSNLLLYGESHNMQTVLDSGINLALGPDWSVSGSKNLLDEMKFARRYLQDNGIKISSEDLVAMVTSNAAKALGMQKIMGSIKKGALANLILVKNQLRQKGFDVLANASQADVDLVVISGEPVYGSKKYLESFKVSRPDLMITQVPSDDGCEYKKYIASVDLDFNNIQQELNDQLKNYAGPEAPILVDPVFSCADSDYSAGLNKYLETGSL